MENKILWAALTQQVTSRPEKGNALRASSPRVQESIDKSSITTERKTFRHFLNKP